MRRYRITRRGTNSYVHYKDGWFWWALPAWTNWVGEGYAFADDNLAKEAIAKDKERLRDKAHHEAKGVTYIT